MHVPRNIYMYCGRTAKTSPKLLAKELRKSAAEPPWRRAGGTADRRASSVATISQALLNVFTTLSYLCRNSFVTLS